MKLLLSFCSLLLAIALFAKEKTPADYITIAPMKPFLASNQKRGEVKLTLSIMKGFHIQANPAAAANLIATSVTMENPEGIVFGNVHYPPGKPYRLAGATSEIATYDKKIEITFPFEFNPNARKGAVTANGKLRFQACNDKTCFFPATLPLSIPLEIQ